MDSDEDDPLDLEFEKIIKQFKKTNDKNIGLNLIKGFIDKYAKFKGIEQSFYKWKLKKDNIKKYNTSCNWFKSTCDLDYFFRQINLI